MIEAINLDSLHNLSDEALWTLFDETHTLLEEMPCGSWERGIARANLHIIVSMIDRRRMAATVGILR